jgi:hypothetical protein
MGESEENLRNTRIPVEYCAEYLLGDCTAQGIITDISEDGFALRTRQVLLVGDKLRIRSEISSHLTLECIGEVQNVQGNRVGILISDIDPNTKQRFLDHIDGVLRLIKKNGTEHFALHNKCAEM